MKRITMSALAAGGLFAGMVGMAGVAGVAQAAPLAAGIPAVSGAIGAQPHAVQANTAQADPAFVNRDIVMADGSINRGGGGWDQNDLRAPSQEPSNQAGWGQDHWSSRHGGYGYGYGYGNGYNYLLWD